VGKAFFVELPQAGLIQFSGADAGVFLANLLTCDVAGLAQDHSTYGAYCTAKGRVLASFLLWRSEQGYFMQLPSSLREVIRKQLSRYVLRSKVTVADATAEWTLLGVTGADAAALIQSIFGHVPPRIHEAVQAPDATVIRLTGDRFELVVANDTTPRVVDALSTHAEKVGGEYWEWLEIHLGIPTITATTQEIFVPQMVNLDLLGGVSFEKGCYPGQEIVARMHYRGTLKQRMYLANLSGTDRPQPSDKLYSADFGDQACGTIVNAAKSPEGGFDLLASMQIASAGKGDVRWKTPAGPTLSFLPLPYVVPTQE